MRFFAKARERYFSRWRAPCKGGVEGAFPRGGIASLRCRRFGRRDDRPLEQMVGRGAPLYRASRDELVALLPFPANDANKYTRGKLTLIAGSDRYPGAACLAARAAARMGAGYIEAVASAQVKQLLLASSPSLVVTSRKKWNVSGVASSRDGHPQAVCVGPGFDPDDAESTDLVLEVLRGAACPVLVDGGAISVLATKKGRRLLKRRFERGWATVVTPHGGEAARLAKPFDLPCDNPSRLATLISLAYGVSRCSQRPRYVRFRRRKNLRCRCGHARFGQGGHGRCFGRHDLIAFRPRGFLLFRHLFWR